MAGYDSTRVTGDVFVTHLSQLLFQWTIAPFVKGLCEVCGVRGQYKEYYLLTRCRKNSLGAIMS